MNILSKLFPAILLLSTSPACIAHDGLSNPALSSEKVEFRAMSAEVRERKYVHVLIDLNVMNSIEDLQLNIIRNFEKDQEDLLLAIEGNYIKGAVWKGVLGQMTLYVNETGLLKLSKSPAVRTMIRAPVVENIYDPDGDIEKIENEIRKNGKAVVSIIPASTVEKNGEVKQQYEQIDVISGKRRFINSMNSENFTGFWMHGTQGINRDVARVFENPSINMEIKLEGLHELRSRKDIKSLKLVDQSYMRHSSDVGGKSIYLDPNALVEARISGRATVLIHLKRYAGYTPITGMLTSAEREMQEKEIREIFGEIVENVEPGSSGKLQIVDGIASAAIELDFESIQLLYEKPDYRIDRVDFSKPIGELALNNSVGGGVGGVNAQYIWKYARGASQWIAVVDSGVQSGHPMFVNKGILQACFGTTDSNYYTTCPVPDINGDTLPGTSWGAAEPCGFLAHPTPDFPPNHVCAHGTHVAGIAAGRGGVHPQVGILNGVAIDANIVAINAISRQRTNQYRGVVYDVDLAKSLEYVRQLRISARYELTVNLSISGLNSSALAYSGNCNDINRQISDLIADLKFRNVAVVASTGNNSIRGGIGYPSCISDVVKVGSINKYTGLFSEFTNIYNPIMYTGQFFLAPGGGIASSIPRNRYGVADGTSMAAPHVTGAIALIKSVAPAATVDDVNNFLAARYSVAKEIVLAPGRRVIIRSLRFS